ncbi:MAG: hypothetical protein HDT39_13325 [Lachnospiraceae bacterium]|nr:hypothetical protein [Lachnospiraceae bacterium]
MWEENEDLYPSMGKNYSKIKREIKVTDKNIRFGICQGRYFLFSFKSCVLLKINPDYSKKAISYNIIQKATLKFVMGYTINLLININF